MNDIGMSMDVVLYYFGAVITVPETHPDPLSSVDPRHLKGDQTKVHPARWGILTN